MNGEVEACPPFDLQLLDHWHKASPDVDMSELRSHRESVNELDWNPSATTAVVL